MITISLLIPVFNHEKFLHELFESIWSQDYEQIQLIAVDDGSTDDSYKVLLECQARSPYEMIVIKKSNGGICSALNVALDNATGELVTVLASDDLLLPDRFSGQIEYFTKSPELKVLYANGRYYINGEQSSKVHEYSIRYLSKGIQSLYDYVTKEVPALFIQSMLIKKSFLYEIGAFDEETNSDDWSLNIRIFQSLKESSEFAFNDVDVFLYRAHPGQFHRSSVYMNELIQRIIDKYLTQQQLEKFKLKSEIACILRESFNLNLSGVLNAIGRVRDLVRESQVEPLDVCMVFMSVIYRSALLKTNRIFTIFKMSKISR